MKFEVDIILEEGWNQLLCYLTTGIDPRKNDKYVDYFKATGRLRKK